MTSGHRGKIYKDQNGEWRWTHWSSSDKVATSGEGNVNRSHTIAEFESLFPDVPYEIVEEGK